MAQVSFHNVTKSYGAVPVIHGVDMKIENGEFIVIVGPSGCGKSTLLRMVAGLEDITGGEIRIDDRVVNDLEPQERDIAMVFQNYALYPHMTVYDNMSYGLRLRRMSRVEIAKRVERVAAILKLEEFLLRKPRELSGGQRQRVAMGRAILREPKVFLFDEPLSNLDAKLRVQMRLEIKKLHQRLGITSIFVTHDQVEAMTLADRLVVMNSGRVEQIGSPKSIYDQPTTAYVGAFIGSPSMNLLDANLAKDLRSVRIAGGPTLEVEVAADVPPGPVTVGIRPEHLEVVGQGNGPFALSVDAVEELGADTLVHAKVGEAEFVVRMAGHARLRTGDAFHAKAAANSIHVFRPRPN